MKARMSIVQQFQFTVFERLNIVLQQTVFDLIYFNVAAWKTSAAFSPHLGVSNARPGCRQSMSGLIPAPPWLAAAQLSKKTECPDSVS